MDLRESDYTFDQRHPWELARLSVILNLLGSVPKSEYKVLDIGSGDAFVADQLIKRYNNMYCYCVDRDYTDEIKENLLQNYKNEKIKLDTHLENLDLQPKCIDLVLFLDVIEHVKEDVDFIEEIRKSSLLKDDAIIIITVPAFQSLFSNHDRFLKHYRRYSLGALRNTIEASGLVCIKGGYFFFSLIFPRLLIKLKESLNSSEQKQIRHIGSWNQGKFLSGLIKNILLMDFWFLRMFAKVGINIPGLSAYAICVQKNQIKDQN